MHPTRRLSCTRRISLRSAGWLSRDSKVRTMSSNLPHIPGSSYSNAYGSLGDSNLIQNTQLSPPRAWQANDNVNVQRVTQQAMIYDLTQQQASTIQSVVPWFLNQMPDSYFRQVPEAFRIDHIKAIAAVKDANMDLYLNLKSQNHDGRVIYTFIRPGTEPGTLLSMVEELGEDLLLTRMHVFSTADETMSLNMFVFGKKAQQTNATLRPIDDSPAIQKILSYAEMVQNGKSSSLKPNPLFEKEALLDYFKKCSDNYLNIVTPDRFLRQRLLFDQVSGTEACQVHLDPSKEEPNHYWIDVVVANAIPQVALQHTCRLLFVQDLNIKRARLDVLKDEDDTSVTLLRLLVTPQDTSRKCDFDILMQDLKRCKWMDNTTMDLVFDKHPWLGVRRGEVITGMCALMHSILAKQNHLVYSKGNIYSMLTGPRTIGHSAKIADLFLDKFNPKGPHKDSEVQAQIDEIIKSIESDVEDTITCELLIKMLDIVKYTYKSNIYMPNRYALGFRLDPKIMEPKKTISAYEQVPHGILFVHGRRFNGYHVRFRDIARGGLRLVTPASVEQYELESSRHYDECYGLAYAQQLKNKDIPEGGAKAVCLIDTNNFENKNFVIRKAVKAFSDTILDLVVDTDETKANIVDYWGKKEVLYLGPDEQVIPEDIDWIIEQAARRGYDTPSAFMSSKPRAGINHKEYGVTSEGVHVFLDVALRKTLRIDPEKESFTIKMTGGPAGDVAGNLIHILIREYGSNVKFVGIADHSGCAEDPNGLNQQELLRLFEEEFPISHFDPKLLSTTDEAALHLVSDSEDATKARNSMHNRLKADAFVPCGGRPNTIDITNYSQFILPNGKPSSKLIVEGANLFVTAEARQALFDEAGVVIVKDSSANKGGVITSSYEIIAAMLLDEDTFYEHKEKIVEEVLVKLRKLARMEAELLFREGESTTTSALPEASQIISDSINTATDALSAALDTWTEEEREELLPLFRAHLPDTLANLAFDRVLQNVPDQYIKNAISSCLASKIVYKEGTAFIEAQPKGNLAEMALSYIQREKEVAKLMETLGDATNIPNEEKKKMMRLLEAGGARTALSLTDT